MRKYFTGFIAAVFAMTAILPLRVLAAGDEVRLKEDGNNVNVSVSVSGGAEEKVASLQLGLQISDQDGNPVGQDLLEQIENLTFSWSQELQARAAITEQRYQKETGNRTAFFGRRGSAGQPGTGNRDADRDCRSSCWLRALYQHGAGIFPKGTGEECREACGSSTECSADHSGKSGRTGRPGNAGT